jgi:hypothetical protein
MRLLNPWVLVAALAAGVACKRRERHVPGTVERLVPESAPDPRLTETERPRPMPPPRARRDASAPPPVRYITDRPAPSLARAEVARRNQAARVECRDSGEFMFCRRALVPVPVPVVATYEFCDGRLCAVALDATRTRDEAQLTREFEQLVGLVRAASGDPGAETRHIGAGCTGHLPLCLTSKQAEINARWVWRDGPQVSASVDQTEDDALLAQVAVTWMSAERARRQDPDAPSAPTDGGAPDAR